MNTEGALRVYVNKSLKIDSHSSIIVDNEGTVQICMKWNLKEGTTRWVPKEVADSLLLEDKGYVVTDQSFPPKPNELDNG